jgi:hypothetical protein
MDNKFEVNGLPLPAALVALLEQGKWRHPGHQMMRAVIPFLHDPVIFLQSIDAMSRESRGSVSFADDSDASEFFHEVRGSDYSERVELPWLDVEKMIFIAVNEEIGADVAIALDYRTSMTDPRVLASEWTGGEGCLWRIVTPTFSEFLIRIGLTAS